MKCPFCVVECGYDHCSYKEDDMENVVYKFPETGFKDGDGGSGDIETSMIIREVNNGLIIEDSEGNTFVFRKGTNDSELIKHVKDFFNLKSNNV